MSKNTLCLATINAVDRLPLCGKILLSSAAIFTLRIMRPLGGLFSPVEKSPELQEVVHTKR
jgi:hypothetical protein